MEQEIWKEIPGYNGLYQVSNLGRVLSLDRTVTSRRGWSKFVKGRILKQSIHHYGYPVVSLLKGNHSKQYAVHVLVGRAFIPNPEVLPCINHKDENKSNNNVDNLEWCTLQYNNDYGTRVKRLTESQRNDPKKSKPVRQLTKSGEPIKDFPSIAEASRSLGVCETAIAAVCKGRKSHFTAGGFKWQFI
jgi:hypothetical protein